MSVMVISDQMMADALNKAKTFRTWGFPTEDEMMSHTFAEMNKRDSEDNGTRLEDFLFRLFCWNILSADKRYGETLSESDFLRNRFLYLKKREPKKIDIYQFEEIIAFLLYNIENHEFNNDCKWKKQMDGDVFLLKKIRREIDESIVRALRDLRGCKWWY